MAATGGHIVGGHFGHRRMDRTQEAAISAEQMGQVLDVVRLLAVTPDLDTLLTRIAESATSLLRAERASIFLHDETTGELWTKVALGAREIRVPASAGIVGHAFQTNALVEVSDPYSDARFNREIDRRSGFVTRNLLTAPTRDMNRKPIGVLQVVNRIGGPFTPEDRRMIELLADQAGVAIQRHYLQQEVVRAAGLRHEMDLARQVQAAMIPQAPPRIAGLQAVGWTLPASVTGGDSYDLWPTADGRLGLFLGDASGHGIGPAIVVSQARTLVRALSEVNGDPSWLLHRVNARLSQDLEIGRFITVFLAIVGGDGRIEYSAAGHGPTILFADTEAPARFLDPLGPPIGVVGDLPCDPTATARLAAGGMLVVLSDGVFEARNRERRLLEIDAVVRLLERVRREPADRVLQAIQEALLRWQGQREPADDQTVVIVRRET